LNRRGIEGFSELLRDIFKESVLALMRSYRLTILKLVDRLFEVNASTLDVVVGINLLLRYEIVE
jgi:hypothetical protein